MATGLQEDDFETEEKHKDSKVNSYDADSITTPATEQLTTTLNPFEKLNISDVTWLTPEILNNGTIELNINGEEKVYQVLLNPESSNSTNAPGCSAPGIPTGKCRHLSQCVMRAVATSIGHYLNYKCELENYLAVCCDEEHQP